MNKPLFRFTFKPAVESQRELIHQWLQQDYISEWIHGQGLQNTLSGLEKFFQYQAKGKGLDRQTEIAQHWIGCDGDKPHEIHRNTMGFMHFHQKYRSP
jgi:hypothetical protein